MISIQGVTFTYPGATTPTLRNLSLEVPQGAFVALVGNNGSGKTTLCKLLTGLVPHFYEGDFSGTVIVAGQNTMDHRVSELSRYVGYVYQDFENQLLKPKVFDDVAFAPLNFGMANYRDRARASLSTLRLDHLNDRIIWELSGGEKHLVALAGVLALEPEILIIDEPISQLDPVNAETIYQTLTYLNKELGKTIITIEHHPDFIGLYCDSVILFKEGSVVWHLEVREALSRIEELEQHDIFSPQVTRIAHRIHNPARANGVVYPINLPESIAFFKKYYQVNPLTPPRKEKEVIHNGCKPMITFQNVTHSYKLLDGSRKRILEMINLAFSAGEKIALVGANGAGKSTLIRLICGLEKPKEGIIIVSGTDTRATTPEELADKVSLVYQQPQQMFIEDSIRKDLSYFLKARKMSGLEEIVEGAIRDFNLEEIQDRDGRLLSGGQMRRASLAIGACMRPEVMLLDEPTSSLDVANRRQIMAMMNKLSDWVQMVIIATHDMELVAEWADRVIILRQGRVLADDTPANIFRDPMLINEACIHPPQVVQLSNALDILPVHLSVDSFVRDLSTRMI